MRRRGRKKRFTDRHAYANDMVRVLEVSDRYYIIIIIIIMVSLCVRRSDIHPSSSTWGRPRPKWLQSRLVPCKCHTRVVDRTHHTNVHLIRAYFSRSTGSAYLGHVSYVRDRCCSGAARRTALLPCGGRRGRHVDEDVPHTDHRKPHGRPNTQLHVRVVRRHRKQAIRRDKEHLSDKG